MFAFQHLMDSFVLWLLVIKSHQQT